MSGRGRGRGRGGYKPPSNRGFKVGPSHAPSDAYLGKAKKLKDSLIERAKIKKAFAKTLKKEGLSSDRLNRGAKSSKSNKSQDETPKEEVESESDESEAESDLEPSMQVGRVRKKPVVEKKAEEEEELSEDDGDMIDSREARDKGKGRDGDAKSSRERSRAGPAPEESDEDMEATLPYGGRPDRSSRGSARGRGTSIRGRGSFPTLRGAKSGPSEGRPNFKDAKGKRGENNVNMIELGSNSRKITRAAPVTTKTAPPKPPPETMPFRNKPLHTHRPLPSSSSTAKQPSKFDIVELKALKKEAYLGSLAREDVHPGRTKRAATTSKSITLPPPAEKPVPAPTPAPTERTSWAERKAASAATIKPAPAPSPPLTSRSIPDKSKLKSKSSLTGNKDRPFGNKPYATHTPTTFGRGKRAGFGVPGRRSGQPNLGARMGYLLEEIQRRG